MVGCPQTFGHMAYIIYLLICTFDMPHYQTSSSKRLSYKMKKEKEKIYTLTFVLEKGVVIG